MKRYLKELKPTVFEDIVAMVALYRPGPMQFIDDFIARKHGMRQIVYPHPSMENSLKNTYGVLVYQEQVMQISKEVCGFTGGEADTLRKAIGKKNAELMAKMKDKMIEGGQKHSGIDQALMNKFWKQLEDFAAYCFNKSHAACYGLIAYQTAYLKAHYPAAFMAALMTSDYDDTDRLAIEITECKHMGIEVLPPDVNESFLEFAVVPKKNQIRFGLNAIKNVGKGAVEEIIRARTEIGHFDTLEDFFTNVNSRTANKKAIESLIKSGAFDRLGNRLQLLENIDLMVAYASKVQKEANSGQTDLFGGSDEQHVRASLTLVEAASPYTLKDELQWERELLGLYLSQHPLESYKTILEETTIPINSLKPEHDGKTVVIGGSIADCREITTKNGQKMAFVQLTDGLNEIEIIVFPRVFQQTLGTWEKDRIILVNGKVSAKDRDGNISSEVKIMADEAREITLEQAQAYQATGKTKKPPKANAKKVALKAQKQPTAVQQKLYIRLSDTNDNQRLLSLKEALLSFIGETEVVLVLGSDASKQIVKLPQGITLSDDALDRMRALAGRENIILK
jgi:DNA polymerase-3 subunit alpha